MTTPIVTIVTPAYNAAKFLPQTVASVQAQTFTEWEMVIVNDGSRDDTLAVAQKLAEKDARLIVVDQKNAGPAEARNKALQRARGRFICFLDSDDVWLPSKLEKQISFMQKKNAAFSFTQYRRFTDDIGAVGRVIPVPATVTYQQLLTHNIVATLTTMVDQSQTGPLTMKNVGYDDFALWLSILKKGFIGYGLQEDLARYRLVSGSVSSNRGRALRWVWNIYRNVEKLNLFTAAIHMGIYIVRVSLKHARF